MGGCLAACLAACLAGLLCQRAHRHTHSHSHSDRPASSNRLLTALFHPLLPFFRPAPYPLAACTSCSTTTPPRSSTKRLSCDTSRVPWPAARCSAVHGEMCTSGCSCLSPLHRCSAG
ncbi:hypothetical protein BC831DRAFT_151137 [Entophlyctis helioformis]|nr:hypothetical protein BC831DRAFT_151137 [Entophlyctis helioformis]